MKILIRLRRYKKDNQEWPQGLDLDDPIWNKVEINLILLKIFNLNYFI